MPLGDQLASMHIGPFSFLLQGRPNDNERFAANFMMHMLVQDIDAWWSRIATLDLAKRYGVKAPTAPELKPCVSSSLMSGFRRVCFGISRKSQLTLTIDS
jgi:hypothetical protein